MSDPTTAKGWRHSPIRPDQPHHGWRDGVYRDDAGIRWELTPPVIGVGVWVPDREDAATRGVLLEEVREAFADPRIAVVCLGAMWRVEYPRWLHKAAIAGGECEWDALTAALHAAPVRA